MESTDVIIARLVLGYLKGEKCKSAYKEFLKTSNHLQEDISLAKTKYLPTRFVGLTLEDILSEYFEIYKIVQGRLESTNYYNERHSETSLVHQLLYLLNKVLSSRNSTPCPRSPTYSNLDDTSISPTEHISDIETTPAHTLPGNIRSTSTDSHLHKTPRRKQHSKFDKSIMEANFPNPDKEDISEVLAQTLLENREFHEKIAQTINKVAEKQNRVSTELDKTIKTVVKETEEDPIFDRILDEIIGSTNAIDVESSSAPSSVAKNNESVNNRWRRTQKISNSADEHDLGYRSYTDSQKVEEQNNEAIRSIIANSKLGANKHADNPAPQGNNEVIVFDGSLDKYLRANTCNANTQTQNVQNPLYINTTGGLLVVPSAMTNVTGNVKIDSSKQYYLVNNQPTDNWSLPTINPPALTEQDILAMPTVLVTDERHVTNTSTKSVGKTPSIKTVVEPQEIVAKPVIEIPNVDEYFTFQRVMESRQRGLKKVLYPKSTRRRKPNETAVNSNTTDTLPLLAKADIVNAQNDTESIPKECTQQKEQPTKENIDNESQESKATKSQLKDDENRTPPLSKISQKITPKSSSHVRNLDFSTPPKITSTHKRSMKLKQGSKSPTLVHKNQASKSLFQSNDSELTDNDEHVSKGTDLKHDHKDNTKKPSDTWDADLRAIIPVDEAKKGTPKRKRTPIKKTKRRVRRPSKGVERQLNTTEHDAARLEAALQTPVKTDGENLKTEEITKKSSSISENISVPPESKCDNSSEAKNEKNNSQTKVSSRKTSKCDKKNKESSEDNHNKLILSPSKLNANKRNLLNTDASNNLSVVPTEDISKFVTPEPDKETVIYPIKANRNITPMLETPLKNDIIPKTPRLLTPSNPALDLNMSLYSNGFTPFTKMLEANLKGIDINSLPTPSIPITPNFPPFTPSVDLISPYSNRPTDYSTSSSYYQPSDSEQNRSLEANLIELEKKPIVIISDVVVKEEMAAAVSGNDDVSDRVIVKEQMVAVSGNEIKNGGSKNDQNKPTHVTTVKEHLSIFNKNVIGKKNLNLMNRNTLSSSSSSDDSTSESSANDDDTWNGEKSNETVIFKKKPPETPKRIYSLRNRCISSSSKETITKSTDTKETKSNRNQSDKGRKINAKTKPTSKANSKQCKASTDDPNAEVLTEEVGEQEITAKDINKRCAEISSFKQKVLKELEEKRLRTINKFKDVQKTPPNKLPTKVSKQSKFIKIKPIPNITNCRRKPRKLASPKKSFQSKIENGDKKALNSNKNKEEGNKYLISGKDADKGMEKSASDVEAQNLIEGLKERGIHLMHNKSPFKKIGATLSESESKVDKKKTETNTNNSTNSNDNCKSKDDTPTSISPETMKHEVSTPQIESDSRETYNMEVFEEYECVIYDESRTVTKSQEDYKKLLKKTIIGKFFIEEINAEIDIPLVLTPFTTLLDFPSTSEATEQVKNVHESKNIGKVALPKIISNKKDIEKPDTNKYDTLLIRDVTNPTISDETLKSDDDLMNYAIVGCGKEETPERSESPQSTRKRKHRKEENSHAEKKCKTLLQNINVDSFLNNIHGGS